MFGVQKDQVYKMACALQLQLGLVSYRDARWFTPDPSPWQSSRVKLYPARVFPVTPEFRSLHAFRFQKDLLNECTK